MKNKNKEAVEIYNIIADDYAKKFDVVVSDEELNFLNKFLSYLKPNSSIVDLGCGTGFSVGYFIKKGMKAQGVDLSKSMIAVAKRNYPDAKFSIADMREFDPGEQIDSIWAGYSLFHFEQINMEKTIKKIKTYLKSNGIFGIVMQEGVGEVEKEDPFLPDKKIYIHLYTEEQLRTILEKHGFEIIDIQRKKAADYEFPYNKILIISRKK